MRYLRKIAAVFWKDVTAELRTKDIFSAMFVFALLSVIIFQFAFDLRVDNAVQVVPGVLWVAISFSGVLGLNRSFALEKDKGSLEGLLLTPVDRSAIYFGKMLANLVFILVVEAFLIPLCSVLFNVALWAPAVLLIVLLGTIGFAAVGTIFAALAVNTRAREVLLPILLLPVMVPVIIAGVRATGGLLDGDTLAELSNWLQVLLVFDIMYLAASFMTFDFIVEE
ncbi:MAG: heme exporter protein CcmB [Anaerolineae bacterium]|uniref:heme exporter protein CcmB n=1 Tax=Candidatus Amarolinea dominans TaxID=3140696 RepID=UPI001DB8B06A|nr:heme exporter protein CcmB [Anaerolineae bacterium]MBK7199569.1 heme exporter protein CcmB [Anaerolineae bacterium]MBK9095505.1 heme exporter protein CcmB [Anaerolineae bacterium]MBK9231795.1 heme exporter protein CcmB [Anaerolineae bacterium]